ncbi:hypothetical protein CDB79_RS18860 [Vibrio parahaemolyticus]|uniref:hypothetical protein n=1 Tax=Vibrio parahaemolyticus TaxID=670 RepID=UPI000E02998F|nr:hypothetical protein [Vibrio parahaemolyticus]EJG1710644.1 hypothetical protein [Vibrio parahaemolyticus]EJG1744021.1 hypothetical protein [Vibrio parahaemolyticus]EJG1781735.1 hypothetical protein [Vibrio parahaemolyticus]SUP22856.1 Uncharacterised protein [Vibrio parahaemolyticus]SUQ25702.1 Uncharacterised protein [Vibrio parahaemolyticus]
MKLIMPVIIATLCAGCASVQEHQISSDLSASEYNNVYAKFYERPTFITTYDYEKDTDAMLVKMDMYGTETSNLFFDEKEVGRYLAAIDKFIEWEDLARSREDNFTKDIDTAPAWNSGNLKFTFHSGNAKNYYLAISFCSLICLEDQAQYYDLNNALALHEVLTSFSKGQLNTTNIDAVYQ